MPGIHIPLLILHRLSQRYWFQLMVLFGLATLGFLGHPLLVANGFDITALVQHHLFIPGLVLATLIALAWMLRPVEGGPEVVVEPMTPKGPHRGPRIVQ